MDLSEHACDHGPVGESKLDEDLTKLFERALEGDRAAYQTFLEIVAGRLRHEFGDEEAVQAALIGIHEKRDLYRPGMPVMSWVRSIARSSTRSKFGLRKIFPFARRRQGG